jgi:signal peptidase I
MDDPQDPGTFAWPRTQPDQPPGGSGPDWGPAGEEPDPGLVSEDGDEYDDEYEDEPDEPGGARAGKREKHFWRELLIIVVAAAALSLVVKGFVAQVYQIPTGSMENTLQVGDRVLVNKLTYHFRGIARGDIIVFSGQGTWGPDAPPPSSDPVVRLWGDVLSDIGLQSSQTYYIKRVIGLPGDRVACCTDGKVTVNGVPLTEGSYLYPGDSPSEQRFNIVVPPGRLWVMGDHRLVSDDSRDHMGDPGGGTIPESAVVGRAFVIIWPISRWRILPIPATFQQPKLNASAAGSGAGSGNSAAETAALLSARLQPSGPALPLSLGFAGALPLTWLQRRVRVRIAGRREADRKRGRNPGRKRGPGRDPSDPGPRRGPA